MKKPNQNSEYELEFYQWQTQYAHAILVQYRRSSYHTLDISVAATKWSELSRYLKESPFHVPETSAKISFLVTYEIRDIHVNWEWISRVSTSVVVSRHSSVLEVCSNLLKGTPILGFKHSMLYPTRLAIWNTDISKIAKNQTYSSNVDIYHFGVFD